MVTVTFEPRLAEFSPESRERWVSGDRFGCTDYCARISGGQGIGGFGEYIVGEYWEQQGYLWIHHDFDIIGANRDGKYESQEILEQLLGERYGKFKSTCQSLWPFAEAHHGPIEQPDLMIYKLETGELRFAECKRYKSRDTVNPRQALGLYLLTALLGVPADIFIVAERGQCSEPLPQMAFTFDEHGARLAG